MSRVDPSRAYNAGALAVALSQADEALTQAFIHGLRLGDYDSLLVQTILDAQNFVRAARGVKVDWHEPEAAGANS